MSMAAMTIHTPGSAKPPSASRIGVPLATIAVRPRSTRAGAGNGRVSIPTTTHTTIAIRRQPCGVTGEGGGTR